MKIRFRKYRIVTDNYNGYEVQHWHIWWPFWNDFMVKGTGISNTNPTIEEAKKLLESGKVIWEST